MSDHMFSIKSFKLETIQKILSEKTDPWGKC